MATVDGRREGRAAGTGGWGPPGRRDPPAPIPTTATLLVQAARALISLPARRSTCRTVWRAPLCQLIDGSSRQSASLKAARQRGYFRVARSKTGPNESFTAPPEIATRPNLRFSGRGRVRRCAVRATSLPCPGNHPGTRPIGWCLRNPGPPPLFSESTQASTSARSYRQIAAERHLRDRPGPGVFPNPAHRHASSSATSFASSSRSVTSQTPDARSRRRGKNEGGRVAGCRPALPLPQGGLRGMGAPPTFDVPICNAGGWELERNSIQSAEREAGRHRLHRLP